MRSGEWDEKLFRELTGLQTAQRRPFTQ
eukprot:COSAG04_NODE_32968_length_188_cov_45.595506_1_plen_27_part_01